MQGRYWRGLPDGTWSATSKYGTLWQVTYVRGKREGACWMKGRGNGVIEGNYHDDRRHGSWRKSVSTDCVQGDETFADDGQFGHLPPTCRGRVLIAGTYVAGARDGEWHFGAARVTFSQGNPQVVNETVPSESAASVVGRAEPGSMIAIGDRLTLVDSDGRFRVSGIEPGRYALINADARRWSLVMLDVGSAAEVDAGKRVLHDFTTDCPARP